MKYQVIILFLLFIAPWASAQKFSPDFETKLGTPYPVVDGPHKVYFTVGDGSVVSVKTRGEIVTVQHFDHEGNEKARKVYEDFPPYMKVQRVIQTTGGIYYIFESYEKKSRVFSVSARKVDPDDASLGEIIELFTTSKKVTKSGRNEDGQDPISGGTGKTGAQMNIGVNFDVFQSFDKSKVLIQYRLYPEDKRDAVNKDMLGFFVFDENMQSVWGKEVQMPHTEAEMNNLAYTVDSKGVAYMLSFLREKKKFEWITINDGDLTNNALDIDADVTVQKFNLIEDKSGKVVCAAYYARGYDYKVSYSGGFNVGGTLSFNTDGIYMFKIDGDGAASDPWMIEFPIELIRQYLNEGQQKALDKREAEGKAGVEDLKMIEFFAQPDGSYIVLGEQRYVRNEFYMTGTTNVGHFSNMILAKISSKGEVIWMKKLPKNQAAALGDSYSQYFEGQLGVKYIAGKGVHYLMFVDNPKNENLSENKVPEPHKNGMGGWLTAYEVDDASGDVKRHTLIDLGNIPGGKNAYQFQVTRICKADAKNFMMEVYLKGKEDGMVTIELVRY